MKPTKELTQESIQDLTYSKSSGCRDVRWDRVVKGFGLRIYPSGQKSYVLKYRDHDRQHLIVLADANSVSLQEGRHLARQKLSGTRIVAGTFSHLCQVYLERHAKPRKKTWYSDQRRIEIYLLPAWGDKKIDDIKRADMAHLHGLIGARAPYEANRVKEIVSRMFELAIVWGLVDEQYRNPTKGVMSYKEVKRDRFVLKEEMPKLISGIEEEQNVYVRNVIWFLLRTGVRKREALRLKWADVNEEFIRIGETKNGQPHYIPMSNDLKALLQETPRRVGNPYVFPGHVIGRPLVNIQKPWDRIRTRADLPDVRIHDLRRTVGSWMAQSGATTLLIGKVLNQTTQQATAVYAHLRQDDVRDALEKHGQRLRNIVELKPVTAAAK